MSPFEPGGQHQSNWNVKLQNLEKWLKTNGDFTLSDRVILQDTQKSGRGLYLKTGKISRNEVLMTIPSECQLNFHTAVYHISQFNPKLSFDGVTCQDSTIAPSDEVDPRFQMYEILSNELVHSLSSFQLLCVYILFEWKILPHWNTAQSFWKPFFDVFPTLNELEAIPALWMLGTEETNQPLFECLPMASRVHAERIAAQVRNDWSVIEPIVKQWCNAFEDSNVSLTLATLYMHFLHIYFVVNSRCLYIQIPLKDSIHDNFTLVPYVDFLNHNADSEIYCSPQINRMKKGKYGLGAFSIVGGSHQYSQPGEEILLSYGAHSNDFLLNEYGFVLAENKWNYIDVSAHCESIIKELPIQDFLRKHDFWGEYTISGSDISYRLLVAIAAKVCPDLKKVEKFMLGYLTEASFDPAMKILLKSFMLDLAQQIKARIETIKKMANVDQLCANNILNIYQGYQMILQRHMAEMT
ncbi:LAME_0E03466g1_1 [Lachancea meyersii CBS 8951]|uniref:LAME_0E03466g1_1 n=1 Tax=Lachancea meyersii CBS 8951 TaxID=1266667 RepID=A0A1G4JGG2_9SACH|nr:LAME_0E03466g1_1 [Lachancea meyersii CBS 8951]